EFNRISHVHFLHPQGEQQIWAKCLLYIGNCHFFVGEVTDSGYSEKSAEKLSSNRNTPACATNFMMMVGQC
ncbi:hypothetical protein, partial [Serpentinimonas maccroryi]|uniref:hypothetical protein n=1 Tax=Serpentinimonas maccroryi TaxID=1458426 RepID=UPI0020336262